MTTSNQDPKRNKDTGTPGNGGRFAPDARAESSVSLATRPLTTQQKWDIVGEALHMAAEFIPVAWVFSRVGESGGKHSVTNAFESADIALRAALRHGGVDFADLTHHDRVAAEELKKIANGVDSRGGSFKDQAVGVAARFSRSLLNRTGYRPHQAVRDTANSKLVKGDVIIGDGFARLEVLDVRPVGAYIEVETAFGPIYLDAEGSQSVAYDGPDDEND